MHQVYVGAKPGRPTLLLIACALCLFGAVGVAWYQVRHTRQLGEEVRIPGSPLLVRPPAGWHVDPQDPAAFVRAVRVEGRGRQTQVQRRIRFAFQDWPTYTPVSTLLEHRNMRDAARSVTETSGTRVGPLPGVQVVRFRQFDFFGTQESAATVYRLAMSPRGEEVNVEYYPLGELSRGDVALLEEVCASVRIDRADLTLTDAQIQELAGVSFRVPPGWRLFPNELREAPGLYVEGLVAGRPAWAISVLRTWLSRPAEELLADTAAMVWRGTRDITPRVEPVAGGRLYSVERPRAVPADYSVVSLHLLARDQSHCALVMVNTEPAHEAAAAAAAEQLLGELEIGAAPFPPGLLEAETYGVELAEALRRGVPEEWGGQASEAFYYAETIAPPDYRHRPLVIRDQRQPQRGAALFEGIRTYNRLGLHLESQLTLGEEWALGPQRFEHAWRSEERGLTRLVGDLVTLRAQLTSGAERFEGARELRLPEAYVPPALDMVAEFRIARGDAPAAVVAGHVEHAQALCRRLVMRIEPDASGRPRALALTDYRPYPQIVTFEGAGRMVLQEDSGRTLERVSPDRLKALFDAWQHRQPG